MKRLLLLMSLVFVFTTINITHASIPTCGKVDMGIGADGDADVLVSAIVTNAASATPLDLTIYTPYGSQLLYETGAIATDEFSISACPYQGRTLKFTVANAEGACEGTITFTNGNIPILNGRSTTVFCDDPLIEGGHIMGVPPTATIPCGGMVEAEFVADWVIPFECVPGVQDTAKIILREYEAFDKNGNRGMAKDTIIVVRFPQLTIDNILCVEKDTTYCGVGEGEFFGPAIVIGNPVTGMCDTIPLLDSLGNPTKFDPLCGIYVAVDPTPFADGCDIVTKYEVEIKQLCYGTMSMTTCPVTELGAIQLAPGYFSCTFWHYDIDTVPPDVRCDISGFEKTDVDTVIFPTSSHDCSAHVYIPPVIVTDICRGIKIVKARIEGYGTVPLSLQADGTWGSHDGIKLPAHEGPFPIYIEAFDSCHNIGYDTCWVKIKDLTPPVAVCDKGVNVSLSGKKIWVEASTFDEGSWDNCYLNFVLARRSDWQTSCVNLCDSLVFHGLTSDHYGDSIFCVALSEDKKADPVEAHYAKEIEWLQKDGQACADLIAQAWRYELCRYATVDCKGYGTDESFHQAYLDYHMIDEKTADIVRQLGGGWSSQVPFDCEDACSSVKVELLVMDYWCNWSKCWTDVWVEDKTPIQIGRDITDEVDISCKSYRALQYELNGSHVSIEDIVAAADAGDADAFALLDEIFGGYHKAWRDAHGNFVDLQDSIIDTEITFYDSTCYCTDVPYQVWIEEDHFPGHWVTKNKRVCGYAVDPIALHSGIVVVNCPQNVQCYQNIWYEFDHCGQGVIYRKFSFINGCENPTAPSGHPADTITRIQKIWVGNECPLDTGMFLMPEDVTIESCGIEYEEGTGNVGGDLHPDSTGYPEYLFDDDCRIVGIAHEDKVFAVVGGDAACYKILRTWYFADWCEVEKPVSRDWHKDPYYATHIFSYVQKLIVVDTIPPVCTIIPIENDLLEVAACETPFTTSVNVSDECGLIEYSWQIKNADGEVVDDGQGDLDMSMGTSFDVSAMGLVSGDYTLKVIVKDQCQNEGICEYDFSVVTGKKPGITCITSATIELTPMDTSGDNTPDVAMGVIWASEYVLSVTPPCNSIEDYIVYRIEWLSAGDTTGLTVPDEDSIKISCDDLPVLLGAPIGVRVWALDTVNGTADFCEVNLFIQTNMQGCGDQSRVGVTGNVRNELLETVEDAHIIAEFSNGQQMDFTTNSTGAYFLALISGMDVQLKLKKDINHMNGISTADMILIQKHILSKQLLGSMYKEEAADVNGDGIISALDLIVLRKLILGTIDRLPNSESWLFLNNESNEFTYQIDNPSNLTAVDWTGIKMGDVTLDNNPKRSSRSNKSLVFSVADQEVQSGNITEIEFKAKDFNAINGFQFTLQTDADKLDIIKVIPADLEGLSAENFGTRYLNNGLLTASYHNAEGSNIDEETVLFTLQVAAKTDLQLSEVLTFSNEITNSEAYTSDYELLNVSLEFNGRQASDFVLYQNRPNPFKDVTTIGFKMDGDASATLTVYDVAGKVVKQYAGDFVKGYNEVVVQKTSLPSSGVYYYQLDTERFTAMKKMILID